MKFLSSPILFFLSCLLVLCILSTETDALPPRSPTKSSGSSLNKSPLKNVKDDDDDDDSTVDVSAKDDDDDKKSPAERGNRLPQSKKPNNRRNEDDDDDDDSIEKKKEKHRKKGKGGKKKKHWRKHPACKKHGKDHPACKRHRKHYRHRHHHGHRHGAYGKRPSETKPVDDSDEENIDPSKTTERGGKGSKNDEKNSTYARRRPENRDPKSPNKNNVNDRDEDVDLDIL